MIEIRHFDPENAKAVSNLVRQVFDEHVAVTFEPEGIVEIQRHFDPAAIAERAKTHMTLEAWAGSDLAGVLELREETRISMLFVARAHMGKGIASQLVARSEKACRSAGHMVMTVHSSLNAEGFYERLGFVPTDQPQRVQGFAFIPMEKGLSSRGLGPAASPYHERNRDMPRRKSIYTQAVHAGERAPRPDFTPVSTPIYPSVGFVYEDMNDLDRVFGGEQPGFVYPRYGSPTVLAFEQAVAALESTDDAVAFASGMGAVHAALLGAGARSGASIVAASDLYGATYALLEKALRSLGMRVRFVDITNLDEVSQAVTEERPAVVVCEIISNPLMRVADVPALAQMAHAAGASLVVDTTFASPYLFQPTQHGTDYAVHSATKYLGGHGDVMAGVVACSAERARDLREQQKLLGANLGPQEAWLALRGLKTLALRMRQHCTNAQVVAEWLASHPAIERVNYPGLPEHPQHALAARLFAERGFGGMLSFDLCGAGQPEVFRFMEALELILPATTLGDVYSLTLYPAHSSHRQVAPEIRAAIGIGDGLVRLSVGIEDQADIIADLAQALDRVA